MLERIQLSANDEKRLCAEIARKDKIIEVLMDRAERGSNGQGSDFDLFQTTVMLEDMVRERTQDLETALRNNESITRELKAAQGELVTSARLAGMAEIANNVLHNVGNVLNSVNISADIVCSTLRQSKVRSLSNVVELIQEHPDDIGEFLARDEKGKLLLPYLFKLAAALSAEQRNVLDELGSLTQNINHIKSIVATQQSHAGSASMIEDVDLDAALEDVLRLGGGVVGAHQIIALKEYSDVPALLLDKSRFIQILVNLLRNAKQAMDAIDDLTGPITLRARVVKNSEGRRLQLSVEDEGEGIAPEHLPQLFVHGFTTRKEGHGFGLHSCALAAKEMGGTLTVHSDGPGAGAVFTLEFPMASALG